MDKENVSDEQSNCDQRLDNCYAENAMVRIKNAYQYLNYVSI